MPLRAIFLLILRCVQRALSCSREAQAGACNTELRPLRKSFTNPKVPSIIQDIVEQAPSPAKYSQGRLFYTIFAEVSSCDHKGIYENEELT
jgi:hypothetical protein